MKQQDLLSRFKSAAHLRHGNTTATPPRKPWGRNPPFYESFYMALRRRVNMRYVRTEVCVFLYICRVRGRCSPDCEYFWVVREQEFLLNGDLFILDDAE